MYICRKLVYYCEGNLYAIFYNLLLPYYYLIMYFQDIILSLQKFWISKGCILLQPYDSEVGAGTSHPATVLRCLDPMPWNICYVQPSRRPADGRYGENPNRVQHYYQMQVIMQPSPENMQQLAIKSLQQVSISCKE